MIDYRIYKRMHPTSEVFLFDNSSTLLFDPRPLRVSQNTMGDEDLFILLPPNTYGFYFTEKKWRKI